MDTRSRRSLTRELQTRSARIRKRNAAFLASNPEADSACKSKATETDVVYECSYCCMVSSDLETVRAHATKRHLKVEKCNAAQTECPFCQHKAEDNASLRVHIGKCEMKLLLEMMVAKHVTSPNDPVKKIIIYNKVFKIFECQICLFKHVSKTAVRRHATIAHFLEVPVFSCIYCNTGIADRGVFDIHLRVSHRLHAIDFSFDCTALGLLNKLLEHVVWGNYAEEEEFAQGNVQKEANFSIMDIYNHLQEMVKTRESRTNKETKHEKKTRSKTKSDAAPKSFRVAVKNLLEKRGDKGGDKSKRTQGTESSSLLKTYFTSEDITDILSFFKDQTEKARERAGMKTVKLTELVEKEGEKEADNDRQPVEQTGAQKPKQSETVPEDLCSERTDVDKTSDMTSAEPENKDTNEKEEEVPSDTGIGRRYNLRHRKKVQAYTENEDDSKEADTPSKHPSTPSKSDTPEDKKSNENEPTEVQPIVIQPLEEGEPKENSKRSSTADGSESQSKKARVEPQVVNAGLGMTAPNITTPAANSLPTILTQVGPQVMQPQSYMVINGQLIPVISPIMIPNVQQQMVLPQIPNLPLQIQQLRPPVLNPQSGPQTPGLTLLGNNLQQNLVLNKQVGLPNSGISLLQPVQNQVQMLPNVIRLPQQNPTVIQSPNIIVNPQQPAPLMLQPSGQTAQFRLEKNAQGVVSLQPIPAPSIQAPTLTVGTPTTQMGATKPQTVRMAIINQPVGTKVMNVGNLRSVVAPERFEAKIDDSLVQDTGADSDADLDMGTIPQSSRAFPDLLLARVYVCGKCRILRTNRRNMVDHILSNHFDRRISEASRRRSIANSRDSYYNVHNIRVMRAFKSWDIPLYRCRHCHLFNILYHPVDRHIKIEHVTVAGLTEPSRHSLHHPRDLVKIGYDVMSRASACNLKTLGIVMKEQPDWSKTYLSRVGSVDFSLYRKVSCKNLIDMAFNLERGLSVESKDGQDSNRGKAGSPAVLTTGNNPVSTVTTRPLIRLINIEPKGGVNVPVTSTKSNEETSPRPGLTVVGHGCMKCQFRDKSYKVVKQHVRTKHMKSYHCSRCDFTATWDVQIKLHIKSVHKIATPSLESDYVKKPPQSLSKLLSTYYDSHPDVWKNVPKTPSQSDAQAASEVNAEESEEQVEPDSSCDVMDNLPMMDEDGDSSEASSLAGISAPNILSCLQDGEEGAGVPPETNFLPYNNQGLTKAGEQCLEEAATVEGSENTTGEAFACKLCAYSCDTLQRIKSHMMSTHIAVEMYPFRCPTCRYEVPSALRLAQHIQYKHQKNAKKNPPKLAREMQNDKELWPQIVPDQKKYERFQQELDCLFRNCVEKE